MASIRPITPSQAVERNRKLRIESIPDGVVEAFNELIVVKWSGNDAKFTKSEIVYCISQKMGVARQEVYDKNWLDVRELFFDAGWDIVYDRPGYNETYEANYTFKRRQYRQGNEKD